MSLYRRKYNPIPNTSLVPTANVLTFKAGVANQAALPLTGNTQNDARIANDTGLLYVWSITATSGLLTDWISQGDILDYTWDGLSSKPSSSVANIDDAVSKRHTQNSDTKLADGTANEVTAANAKDAVNKKHTQGTDQGLDTGGLNATTAAEVKTAVTNSHALHADDQVIPDQLSDLTDDATHRLVTDTEKSTWNGKQDALGFTPEDVSNKDTTTTLGTSDTKYPSQKAVKSYVDALGISTNTIRDLTLNIMLNAFRIAQQSSLAILKMVDQFVDEYEDETGIDTANSTNESYNSSDDYYSPSSDSYTKLLLHCDGSNEGVAFTDAIGKTVTNTATYDSYTKLLLHLDNNVTDAIGKTVTNNNVTFSDTVKKYGTHSALFDSSSDSLTALDNDDWYFGTGDFTIDAWIRPTLSGDSGYQVLCGQFVDGSTYWYLRFNIAEDSILFNTMNSASSTGSYSATLSTSGITANTWAHIAIVRNGANFYLFVNGISVSLTTSTPIGTLINYSGNLEIGNLSTGSWGSYLGYIDELRISKGIARWTSNFTPYRSAYGQVATITADKKFGTACAEFHGSGDYLSLADSDDWNFGTGDFTIDTYIRFSNTSGIHSIFNRYVDASNEFRITYISGTGAFFYSHVGGVDVFIDSWSWTPTVDTWYHIALIRYNNNMYCYIDGTSLAAAKAITGDTGSFAVPSLIGVRNSDYYLNGYIDEFRVSKGIARWTANFTPEINPYNIKNNMTLLSNAQTAEAAPTSARLVLFEEDVDAITLNTDIKGYVSRDSGTTYSQVTLEDCGNYVTGAQILQGVVDISAQPSGTNMKYKVETLNNKDLKLHGAAVSWK